MLLVIENIFNKDYTVQDRFTVVIMIYKIGNSEREAKP